MSNRFRPQLNALEARDVPAAFSFQLPDGTAGSGYFSAPAGVDPAEASQSLALTDLSVTYAGAGYAVASGATAAYAAGVLTGVTATATTGTEPAISLSGTSVQVGTATAAVAYDAAATRMTFALFDGTSGAISFDVPWGQVDASLSYQTVAPTAFRASVGGQTYALGSATFPGSPALVFESGAFTGVNFEVSTPAGSGYSSIAIYGQYVLGNVTGSSQQVYGSAQIVAPVVDDTPAPTPQLTFTLPDDAEGSIFYDIPWDDVDAAQASQSVAPTNFKLTIAGEEFAYGSSSYTTAPALVFEYGEFKGVTFALDTTYTMGFAYTSLSASFNLAGANIITAIEASTGAQLTAPIPKMPAPKQEVFFNFNSVTTGKAYTIDLTFTDDDGKLIAGVAVEVAQTDTRDTIGNKVAAEINASGLFVATYDGGGLIIKPTMNGKGRTWTALNYAVELPNGLPDPTIAGPSLGSAVVVTVTGRLTTPPPP